MELKDIAVTEVKEKLATPEEVIPACTDVEWTAWVLKQLELDEMFNGYPKVDGLRRLTVKLIGNIVKSQVTPWVSPSIDNMYCATVTHTIEIEPHGGGTNIVYTEISDVNPDNTNKEYGRFPSALAATRAEGRNYRKALMLRGVVMHEELSTVPKEELSNNGFINATTKNFIEVLCKRTGINLTKFLQCGKKAKYAKLDEVPEEIGSLMIKTLREYQRKEKTIPGELLDG